MQLVRFKTLTCFLALLVLASGCNPPPMVDAPASDLDVRIMILDIYSPMKDLAVTMQFLQNGTPVEFGSNAKVLCDGVELKSNGLAYAGRVLRRAVGGAYSFSYDHNGIETLNVVAQKSPVITSPVVDTIIDRTTVVTIAHIAESSAGVRGYASDGNSTVGGNPDFQPDNGTYNGINAGSLKAGPGSLRLTREYRAGIPGTNFKSAEYTYDIASDTSVVLR